MHEINLLFTVAGVMFLLLFLVVRYFMRRAKAKGQDTMIAARNGLLVALALFALFVVIYEENREKKMPLEADPNFCVDNPWECAEPPAITR